MFRRLGHLYQLWRSLARDARTPLATKAFPWFALFYLLLPFDIIPDIFPILGQLDDLGIVTLLLWAAFRAVPPSLWNEHSRTHDKGTVIDV